MKNQRKKRIMNLMEAIEAFFKKILEKRVAVLGVGSELRGDDGVGPYLSEKLSSLNNESFLSINGNLVPENFTKDIKNFKPENIIIIDAAYMGKSPGDIEIINISDLKSVSFSSHAMPLSILGKYLSKETGANVFIIGVQVFTTEFGTDISQKVKESIDRLFETIKKDII